MNTLATRHRKVALLQLKVNKGKYVAAWLPCQLSRVDLRCVECGEQTHFSDRRERALPTTLLSIVAFSTQSVHLQMGVAPHAKVPVLPSANSIADSIKP